MSDSFKKVEDTLWICYTIGPNIELHRDVIDIKKWEWDKKLMGGLNMLQFGMPTLIEIESLEDTMKLCRRLGLSFVELNMNLPQYQIECLENIACLKSLQEKYQIGYTIHLDENLNISDFNKLEVEK